MLQTDVSGNDPPISYILNFVPIVSSPGIGSKGALRFVKRRGYRTALVAAQTGYFFSKGIQWTGLLGTGATPSTTRGVLAYTQEKLSTDLKLYKWDTSETLLGTFSTAGYQTIGIQETLISNVANLTLAVKNTASPFDQKLLFFPNAGSLTEVTDGDFPAATFIGNPVHMDGYCFIATTAGTIWNSDVNSLANWTATSFISAQSVPDSLVGLARMKNLIVGLGTRSIEFFQNAGNGSGSPLQRIDSAALQIGVLHQLATQKIGDSLLFVSVSSGGTGGVYMLSGTQFSKVSDSYIDLSINRCAYQAINSPLQGGIYKGGTTTNDIRFCGTVIWHGVEFAFLYIDGIILAYAPSLERWFEASCGAVSPEVFSSAGQNFALDRFSSGASAEITYSFEGETTPGVDRIFGSSGNFSATLQTAPLALGSQLMKFYESLRIIGDLESGSTPITVQYSDDNGANFTTAGTIDMSANPPVMLTRLGASRKRVWRFTNASTGGCAIDAAALTYREGTS